MECTSIPELGRLCTANVCIKPTMKATGENMENLARYVKLFREVVLTVWSRDSNASSGCILGRYKTIWLGLVLYILGTYVYTRLHVSFISMETVPSWLFFYVFCSIFSLSLPIVDVKYL